MGSLSFAAPSPRACCGSALKSSRASCVDTTWIHKIQGHGRRRWFVSTVPKGLHLRAPVRRQPCGRCTTHCLVRGDGCHGKVSVERYQSDFQVLRILGMRDGISTAAMTWGASIGSMCTVGSGACWHCFFFRTLANATRPPKSSSARIVTCRECSRRSVSAACGLRLWLVLFPRPRSSGRARSRPARPATCSSAIRSLSIARRGLISVAGLVSWPSRGLRFMSRSGFGGLPARVWWSGQLLKASSSGAADDRLRVHVLAAPNKRVQPSAAVRS
jgi:hypothetical protein